MTERCDICKHALSVHNELGYCWVRSRSKGDCMCDRTASSRQWFPVTDPDADAPDGEMVWDPERKATYQRVGLEWCWRSNDDLTRTAR